MNVIQIGNAQIDSQHNQIFTWLDKLEQAYYGEGGQQLIGDTLHKLCGYVDGHFSTEERLMKEVHYPHLVEHRQLHLKLSAEVNRLLSEFQDDQPVLSIEIIHLLRHWLVEHINKVDAELGKFIDGRQHNSPSAVCASV